MASRYGSNEHKLNGIQHQSDIIKKVLIFLRSKDYKVEAEPTSLNEDRRQKIDCILKFDTSTPFNGKLELKIDVKYGISLTVISDRGINVIEKSMTDYIIFNIPYNQNELLWVNTRVLRECLRKNPPMLIKSYEKGNNSKFIWIKKYLNDNKEFFGNTSKSVLIN